MNGPNDISGTTASQQNITVATPNNGVMPPEFVGRIETPYGVQYINRGEASDHASMRSAQLSALLVMMQREGGERFQFLSPQHQDSYLWLITELSKEVGEMFDIATDDALRSAK